MTLSLSINLYRPGLNASLTNSNHQKYSLTLQTVLLEGL